MTRHHAFNLTLHNYRPEDLLEIQRLFNTPNCDYYIFGFEGCETHPAHIHFSFHLKNAVTVNNIKGRFEKMHHIEVTRDIHAMHDYIRGYEKGQLKCKLCATDNDGVQCNVYFTDGEIPRNGKNKDTSGVVIKAIDEGYTLQELRNSFPSYMLYHEDKVKRWMQRKDDTKTKFYWFKKDPAFDPITTVHNYFIGTEGNMNLAVIFTLEQIEGYEAYDYVLYMPEFSDRQAAYWPRGVPIMYKYGYETKVLKCKYFIICSDIRPDILYKNIC